jgi:hypothetical protein
MDKQKLIRALAGEPLDVQTEYGLAALPINGFNQSNNIEDRRDEPNPNRAEWANVIPHLMKVPGRLQQYFNGVPIPEEAAPTDLSRKLGHLDIGNGLPTVGSTSALDYILYDIEHAGKTAKDIGKAVWNEFSKK